MRILTSLLAAGLLVAGLASCGEGGATATDAPRESPSVSPSASTDVPLTVGTYPEYPNTDYDYTLRVSCYCPNAGEPMRISVRDGEAVSAVFLRGGLEHHAGDPVEGPWAEITLADVIAAANDTEADRVDVTWPSGQDYPTSVWVDRDEMAADEEVGYEVRRVVPVE